MRAAKYQVYFPVRIPIDLNKGISAIADQEQQSKSALVRLAIAEFLEKRNAKTSEVA